MRAEDVEIRVAREALEAGLEIVRDHQWIRRTANKAESFLQLVNCTESSDPLLRKQSLSSRHRKAGHVKNLVLWEMIGTAALFEVIKAYSGWFQKKTSSGFR